MSIEFNRADIIDLRERVNRLEEEQTKLITKVGVVACLISLVVPSLITIAPTILERIGG